MLHYDTGKGLDDLHKTVSDTVRALGPRRPDFDSIAVQGVSGLLVGSPAALLLGKPLVIVRRDSELRCHHTKRVEGARDMGTRVLFLDDQISTGRTLADVRNQVRKLGADVTGTYLYQYDTHDAWELGDSLPYDAYAPSGKWSTIY